MGSDVEDSTFGGERMAMLAALLAGDVTLAYRMATTLLADGVTFDEIMTDVLAPVQWDLGARWAAGDLGIADEHAASAAIEELVIRLGAVAEEATGPLVVVANPEHDAHALGTRVVAASLALDGFRVAFIGASVPAADLADYLELQQPLALALGCSTPAALPSAVRSIAAAHDLGVPVVGGGRAVDSTARARRLGLDGLARSPREAVEQLRSWEATPPGRLAVVPESPPEARFLADRGPTLVGLALDGGADVPAGGAQLADELGRVLRVLEAALMLDEPGLLADHVAWLRVTGAAHGLPTATVDAALGVLASEIGRESERAGQLLVRAID